MTIEETARTFYDYAERLKSQHVNEVIGFIAANVEQPVGTEIKVSNTSIRYADYQTKYVVLTCEVSLVDIPEKQQVPILRRLEAAWDDSGAQGSRRNATYHPTSKHYSRRLKLEQTIRASA